MQLISLLINDAIGRINLVKPINFFNKRLSLYVLYGLCVVLLFSCSAKETISTAGSTEQTRTDAQISLQTLSTKPWLVSGGDVLIELTLDKGISVQDVVLALDGIEQTSLLNQVAPSRFQAVIRDLPEGDSVFTAGVAGQESAASLILSNYPISGPVISGPHETPFQCQTEEFELVSGELLGPAIDSDCSIPTRIDYVYWSAKDEIFKPLNRFLTINNPEDMAEIVNFKGESIPYIVRVETGTVNRAIYEIAMLHDSADGGLNPWNSSKDWNGKLVYTHGGGCRGGWYQQGSNTGGVMRHGLFEQGYAVTSSTLNVFGQNCNDLLASETHIMVKERFIENYGVPEYTIATGSSGGSYQSHQTADNYPGVFDGIIVGSSFPDVTSATIFTVADARLLNYYFTETNGEDFTIDQQRAISGFGSWASISNLARGAARLDPIYLLETPPEEQGGEVSINSLVSALYNDLSQSGIRATVYDHTVNVYGVVEEQSEAQRPLDNVGVQYGLSALNDGIITVNQFLKLNSGIGGFDRDMNHVPQRHRADPDAREKALESGRILFGGAGLASTPIIDYRSYRDHVENGDIHMIVHQFSTRQRLLAANGHSDNHVMQVGGLWGFSEDSPDLGNLFRQMDSWLMAIANDEEESDRATKVVINKPISLVDACWDNNGDQRLKIEQDQIFDGSNECSQLYPAYPTPRHVAGGPLANNIVSCNLRGANPSDYALSFDRQQFAELNRIFPDGVCDWARGDISGAVHQGTWASFGPSPVNKLY
jgi:hypothetical protein